MKNLKLTGKRKILSLFLAILLIGGLFVCAQRVYAIAQRQADVNAPSSGNVFVKLDGKFYAASKEDVLNRLNEIRREACEEHVDKLTMADYVPLEWSDDLERSAQMRAAEASIFGSHDRPNGKDCFSAIYNKNGSWAENLAWNYSGIMKGIEQFYEEKEDLENNMSNNKTGHYTAIITPEYQFVGVGGFKASSGNYIATAMELSPYAGSSRDAVGVSGDYTQVLEVSGNYLSGLTLDGKKNITVGEPEEFKASAKVVFSKNTGSIFDYNKSHRLYDGATWSSSNEAVATVDKYGNVEGVSEGTATISAKVGSMLASFDVESSIHRWITKVTKATTSKNGKIQVLCEKCGEVKSSETIYYAKSASLSTSTYTYNGKARKPSVTVKDSKGNVISSSNYSVSYPSGRKSVGKYTVTIKLKGNYSGTIKKTFTIRPKSTSLASVSGSNKKITVKWKKQASQTTGYQIQYSTSSKFSNAKYVRITKNSQTKKTISKLKAKKKYYARVRTYKKVKVNGKYTYIYSSWSKAKSVKTK